MYKRYLLLIFLFFTLQNLHTKSLNFEGLSKFTMNDIQSITSVDIYDENLKLNDINKILKELASSDLIYEISYKETNDFFIFTIVEGNIIENVYINNNIWIKDDLIIQNLSS